MTDPRMMQAFAAASSNHELKEHHMGLDIRIPLGLIFLLIGGLMSIYGLVTRNAADIYEKSMGINLNLTWGASSCSSSASSCSS